MTTKAHSLTTQFARDWEALLPSATFSGIVGDQAHRLRGGYHISIEDQGSGNYSVTRVDDKAPPGNWPRDLAAGVDMSMSKADMITTYNRVMVVWTNPDDPRRKFFNAVNVYDGVGDAERLDFVTNQRSYASPDHKWHNHLEIRRRYVTDPRAYDAGLSMLRGEGLMAYLERTGQAPVPPPAVGGKPGTRTLRYVPGSTFAQMMKGEDVAYVQRFIGEKRMGKADGVAGPKFAEGVRWYQGIRGIERDGVVGKVTWSHILQRKVDY